MKKSVAAVVCAVAGLVASTASAQIIYDNQSSLPGSGTLGLVTHAGGGFGGADASALTAPDTTFGATANTATAFRLADDFTVPAGQSWTISGANIFGYTTGATAPTMVGATVRFFSNDPLGLASGTVIAGDTTTNVQTTGTFYGPTAIYRVQDIGLLVNNRRVQQSSTSFAPIVLGPGTYWIDFALTSSTGAVFTPLMSLVAGGAVTGNARQLNGTYVALQQGGSLANAGVPFQLVGTIPGPSSIALIGIGGLVAARRRRN
jgi:hypothetical protein